MENLKQISKPNAYPDNFTYLIFSTAFESFNSISQCGLLSFAAKNFLFFNWTDPNRKISWYWNFIGIYQNACAKSI